MVRLKSKKTKTGDSISTIGERLKRAREEKGISLEEAHRATKIHPNVLEALEEDRLENILSKAYVKGFIKSYAQYLGLDVNSILEQYSLKQTSWSGEKPTLVQKPVLQKKDRRFSQSVIVALAFIIWLSILSFATVRFINSYKSFTQDKKPIAPKRTAERPKKTKRQPAPAKEILKSRLIPIPKSRSIELTILTSRDVWLKVMQDGELAFHGILSENSKETWQANSEIRLSQIGRPKALKLIVNGKDVDLSGKRLGKNILVTHKGIDLEPGS